MVAMLAFGGTFAYFTATASNLAETKFGTAKVVLTNNEITAVSKDNLLPKDELISAIEYKDQSTVATHIFVVVTLKLDTGSETLPTDKKLTDLIELGLATSDFVSWGADTNGNAVAYYKKGNNTAAGTATQYKLSDGIKVKDITSDTTSTGSSDGYTLGDYQGVKFTLKIEARSIQALDGENEMADEYAFTTLFGTETGITKNS